MNGLLGVFAFETLTVSNVSLPLTSSVYNKADTGASGGQVTRKIAKFAQISVETNSIRFRVDGTAPTSSVGHLLNAGDVVVLESEDDVRNWKAIRVSADATIMASYVG